MKRLLTISILAFALSGCGLIVPVSYSDKQTPEQKQQLSGVLDALAGDYIVVDSRKDDLKMVSLTVKRRDNDLLFIVNQKNGQNFLVTGQDCTGYSRESWKAVMCHRIPEGLNFITFDLLDKPREIKDNAIILPFPTMEVKAGDYLVDFDHRGGRPNYYVLKKSTSIQ
jgi:hypothetical protein